MDPAIFSLTPGLLSRDAADADLPQGLDPQGILVAMGDWFKGG